MPWRSPTQVCTDTTKGQGRKERKDNQQRATRPSTYRQVIRIQGQVLWDMSFNLTVKMESIFNKLVQLLKKAPGNQMCTCLPSLPSYSQILWEVGGGFMLMPGLTQEQEHCFWKEAYHPPRRKLIRTHCDWERTPDPRTGRQTAQWHKHQSTFNYFKNK